MSTTGIIEHLEGYNLYFDCRHRIERLLEYQEGLDEAHPCGINEENVDGTRTYLISVVL